MADSKRSITIGFVVAVAAGLVVEWTKDFPVLRWLGRVLVVLVGWLRTPYLVERWYLGVLSLLALALLLVTLRRALPVSNPIPWLSYTRDTFLGIEWQWSYTSSGQFDPHSLLAVCPSCQLMLRFGDVATFAAVPRSAVQCPECGFHKEFEGDLASVRDRVTRLAERKVRLEGSGPHAA
jgi:hypothetical protein